VLDDATSHIGSCKVLKIPRSSTVLDQVAASLLETASFHPSRSYWRPEVDGIARRGDVVCETHTIHQSNPPTITQQLDISSEAGRPAHITQQHQYVDIIPYEAASSTSTPQQDSDMEHPPPRPAPIPKDFDGLKFEEDLFCSTRSCPDYCQECGRELRRVAAGQPDTSM
jgi:hypothetical protein